MNIHISSDPIKLGMAASGAAAKIIRQTIQSEGFANVILATGTSQFETLRHLVAEPGIDWSKVTMFHLDEYIGLPLTHAASFRKYLTERFLNKVVPLKAVHLINGEGKALEECQRLGGLIRQHTIHVALVGIGENGHLAFNDPPADFETEEPYVVVNLDEKCRRQQFNEGWFKTIDDVPRQAISMSVKQIMRSENIVCSVPDARKAEAVKNSVEQAVSNRHPASVLQQHNSCTLFLDTTSACDLNMEKMKRVNGYHQPPTELTDQVSHVLNVK